MTSEPAEEIRDTLTPVHHLNVNQVLVQLDSDLDVGLTVGESAKRLERWGPNALAEVEPISKLAILLHQFQSPLVYILLIASVITLSMQDYVDTVLILGVVGLNAVIGYIQEFNAENSARALMRLVSPQAKVLRGGKEVLIESRDLVPGDVVLLESGVRIPADLRLFKAVQLTVDESALTGESLPVSKSTAAVEEKVVIGDRRCMAYAGTVVSGGRGRGLVSATGVDTELGRISESVREEVRPDSPLQQRMTKFAHLIGFVVAGSAFLSFVVGVLFGKPADEMFRVGVALAVGAIPEGLPVVLTITLALGVRRMAKRNAIIRRLPAVETLGSTTVIGSDKTGTLTENRMTVRQLWTLAGDVEVNTELHPEEQLQGAEVLRELLNAGVFSNEAQLGEETADEHSGDPTELALLVVAQRFGLPLKKLRVETLECGHIPFESERQFSGSYRQTARGIRLYVKGAPEKILSMCSAQRSECGEEPLQAEGILHQAEEMAARGLRVLAFAISPMNAEIDPEEMTPSGLVFLGLQGMLDPPREGVKEAIAGCKEAGLKVIMITGDHAKTALAIGTKLGLADSGSSVVTGQELEEMTQEELIGRLEKTTIFARVSPEHKLRVVQALQARGDVVAVTGDGVNDAPALKAADIGVAMGKEGTDVAREASDMILADDNFTSIYAAVEEGRITFDNVRKVTFFLISTGAAQIFMIVLALLLDWPLPLLPAQILWLNLVTNGLQDVALAFEPGEPGVTERPPRRLDEGIVSRVLWERTILAGAVMALGTLYVFYGTYSTTGDLTAAQTMALHTMVLFQIFHVGNARSERRSAFVVNPFSNIFLFIAAGLALAVHLGATTFAPTQALLQVNALQLSVVPHIALVASSIIVAMEFHKLLSRWR